ncbi:MAG: hypothetical protein EAZ89_13720 [Bacteroidetes bacterium]|nr:MAG: hypothetical protein EAZ89_13720 [Bacteroidota bacterium]
MSKRQSTLATFFTLATLFPALKKKPESGKYTELRPDLILQTIVHLEKRICERFPVSGLSRVCAEFRVLAGESEALARQLRHPVWVVRIASVVSGVLLLGLVVWALTQLGRHFTFNPNGMPDLLQATESAINELIFMGLALFTLMNLESHLKRRAALQSLHQLRSIAHVVDMHQLTKDPAFLFAALKATPSSPERILNKPQLNRYLDYCSELLALIAKTAALFGQNMDDPIVLNAVNDVEQLAQGLSVKIWQKIMVLDLAEED